VRNATVAAGLVLLLGAGLARCAEQPLPLPSAVRNGGFEQMGAEGALPDGWEFRIMCQAQASAAVDAQVPRSGRRAVRFSDASPMAPHVYGRFVQTVPVEPGIRYRLTVWARGRGVGRGIHFTDWQTYRLRLPAGDFDWRRFSATFETEPDQRSLDVGLNVVDVTDALWIDDLSLTPVEALEFDGAGGVAGTVHLPSLVASADDRVAGRIWLDAGGVQGRVEVTVTAGQRLLMRQAEPIAGDLLTAPFTFQADAAGPLVLQVRVLDASDNLLARAAKEVTVRTAGSIRAQLDEAQGLLDRLRTRIAEARRGGRPVDYSLVVATVAEHFIGYARCDIERGQVRRAAMEADELLGILTPAVEAAGDEPPVPRYRTGEIGIEQGSFVAETEAEGHRSRRPVFFNGYGHFGQVRADIEAFPRYGINVIQIEFGPRSVVVGPDATCDDAIEEFLAVLDRAAANNVAVNLLISPHYFPEWALEKWPHLRACSGGFLKYCIDAPESQAILRRHLEAVIPRIRGKPGLHSICLSNEPIYIESRPCRFTQAAWRDWLERRHGEIAALNRRYDAAYASFAEVPMPDPEAVAAGCHYCDWALFNAERLAAWHRWLADVIHEMAPEIPVHAKIMNTLFDRPNLRFGVDPEQFSKLSQINGNDAANYYDHDDGADWANGWVRENMFYDLQRSMAALPGLNSENHLIRDRDFESIPAAHVRNVLWQGAVHGQGAATIWVWERTDDDESDFAGSIMHRPACAEAVGRTNLDLNRLAEYVTTLQRERPRVGLLYSYASIVWSDDYLRELESIYTALDLSGLRVGFVSERQLAEGGAAGFRLIVAPAACAVSDDAYAALRRFAEEGGVLALIGDQALAMDHFGEARDTAALRGLETVRALSGDRSARDLWELVPGLLREAGVEPPVMLLDPETGERIWGVEWLCTVRRGAIVVNAVNYLRQSVRATLSAGGARASRDLFSGQRVDEVVTLKPMEPALLLIE